MLGRFTQLLTGNDPGNFFRNFLLKGSFQSMLINVSGMGLNFVSGLVLAHYLHAEGYGFYTLIFTWVSVLSSISVFGLDDLLVRELSKDSKENSGRAVIAWGMKTLLFTTSVTCTLALAVILLFTSDEPDHRIAFLTGLATVPFYVGILIAQAILRGRFYLTAGQAADKLFRPVLFFLGMTIVLWLFRDRFTTFNLIVINVLAHLILVIGYFFYTSNVIRQISDSPISERMQPDWLKSSLFLFSGSLLGLINVRADILMLGAMSTDAEVGVYNIAARLSDLAALSLLFVTPVIAPVIARLMHEKNHTQLQSLITGVARMNTIFGLIVSIGLFLVGPWFFSRLGEGFETGNAPTLLLCLGQMVTLVSGPAGNLLIMTGHEKQAFYMGLAGMLLNIGLNLLLIPVYGAAGAAFATAISCMIWNAGQAIAAHRKTGIKTWLRI